MVTVRVRRFWRTLGLGLTLVAGLVAGTAQAGIFGVPTNLNANGTVSGTSVNPPGWFVLTGPTAANSVGDTVHQLRLFIEVENRQGGANETLDIRVFDPGASGARDATGTTASSTTYELRNPAGTVIRTGTIGDDTAAAPPTENRLARFSSTGGATIFYAADGGTVFTGLSAGLYELRITVTSGNETNAFGVDIRDQAGAAYNVFTVGSTNSPDTAFVAGSVTDGAAIPAAVTQPMILYPYVSRGCSISTSNYDMDAGTVSGAGASAGILDTFSVTTALAASSDQLHVENTVLVEPTATVNLDSNNYGMFTLTNDTGTQDNRGIQWRVADFMGWNTNPLALPRDAASPVRMYLPNAYAPVTGNPNATAPLEARLAVGAAVLSGTNPPQVGQVTNYLITASVDNLTGRAITNVAITVPLVAGLTVSASAALVDGAAATCTETIGVGFRSCTFATLAAGSVASYQLTTADTPTATGLRRITGATTTRSAQMTAGGLTYAAALAAANTTAAHGFQTGDYVTIYGAEQAGYNGLFQITSTGANTFTYVPVGAPVSPATGATILANVPGCPAAANGPVCATYAPSYASTTRPIETLGPLCPLTVYVTPTNINLGVTKTAAPNPVTAGQNLTYTLTVTNPAGSGTASNVILSDTLPANTTFRSVTAPITWTCASPPVGTRGTVACTIASLAASTTSTFTIVVRVDPTATGTISNTANVSALGTDTNPANNSATATVNVNVPPASADLAITKSAGPTTVVAGSDVTYTMTVTNNGPAAANAPTFNDRTPRFGTTFPTTFRALTVPAGWTCPTLPAIGGSGNITCNASGPMAAGQTATFVLVVRTAATSTTGTVIGNTGVTGTGATIASTTTDPVAANNAATASSTVGAAAATPTCATPARDGDGGTLTGVINTYYPATASAAAGATSITLGAATGSTTPIAVGDLLLVIQMQDATIQTNNNDRYGDNTAGDGVGTGYTALNSTGLYEFARAASAVPLTGGALTISTGLTNAYRYQVGTDAQSERNFQVVRVPQYATATLGSTLTAAPWNGATGGILVIDVAGTLELGGATVDVSGKGFRGGGGRRLTGDAGTNTDYRTFSTLDSNGSKGEGIAGTPRYIWDQMTDTLIDNGVEGYASGSHARGAPGSAGGGSTDGNPAANDQNSGGGGGGNGGIGGQGGNTWYSNLARGGFGGAAVPPLATRVVLGGGAGAGTRNNSSGVHSSGGTGGGMIFIRAASVGGTGTLNADGWDGLLAENDGAGGGGAGGTIVVSTMAGSLSGLIGSARGGNGGNAWPTIDGAAYPGNRHGPGGGGGGGVILLSSAAGLTDVSGGASGTTTTALDPYNAAAGSAGVVAIVAPSAIPGVDSGAECSANLSVVKTPVPSSPTPTQATYNIVVTNNGFRTATNVTVVDALPIPPVTYSSATPSQGACAFASPTVTCNLGSIASGASATVRIVVNSAGGAAPANTANVDATEPDPDVTDDSGTSGAEADLAVTLEGTPEPVAAGQVLTYTATVQNNGPNQATAATFTFALPALTTFNTLLEPAGWTCTTPALGAGGTVTCARTSAMPVLASETFRIAVLVSSDAPPNTALPATAEVSSAGDTNSANDAATIVNHVIESVMLLTRAAIRGVRIDPDGGLIEFATGWQRGTVAFNLYATPGPDGPVAEQAPLNRAPVRAPRATTLTPTLYRCEVSPFAATHVWIEEIESGGRRSLMGPFAIGDKHLAQVYSRLEHDAEGASATNESGSTARMLSLAAATPPRAPAYVSPVETAAPLVWQTAPTSTAPATVEAAPAASGTSLPTTMSAGFFGPSFSAPAVTDGPTISAAPAAAVPISRTGLRVEFDQAGLARVTRAELVAAGLPPSLPLSRITVTTEGQPVASSVLSPNLPTEALSFWVAKNTTVYTGRSVYVLTWGSTLPLMRVALTREGDAAWPGCVRVEKSTLYVASVPLGTDPWLWDVLTSDGSTWPEYDPAMGVFTIPALLPRTGDIPVVIRLVGMTPHRHQVGASINGVPVGSVAFEGITPTLLRGMIPRAALKSGADPSAQNELTLSYSSDAPPEDPGIVYLDHLDFYAGRAPSTTVVTPRRIALFDPQLPALQTAAPDYVILTHTRFADQAQRLANIKTAAGHRTMVVDVQRIYDQFSGGYIDAEAIRAYLYVVCGRAPLRYVLLFGDDTLDPRDEIGTGAVSYVPSLYGWDGEYGRVPSETRFANAYGDAAPDFAIGRLPAKNEAEATLLVDKIQRQAAWLERAGSHLFVIDRDDPTPGTPSFVLESLRVAKKLAGTTSITWADAAQGAGAARSALFGTLQQGVGFTHVFAHGAPWQWGNTGLLTTEDVAGVAGAVPALPDGPETVVLTWACDAQMYTYLWGDSVNEALLLRNGGGALAVFGPAGIVDMAAQATLYERLYTELRTAPTLGVAIQRAKAKALAEDSRAWRAVAGWNLLGDPALPLR